MASNFKDAAFTGEALREMGDCLSGVHYENGVRFGTPAEMIAEIGRLRSLLSRSGTVISNRELGSSDVVARLLLTEIWEALPETETAEF